MDICGRLSALFFAGAVIYLSARINIALLVTVIVILPAGRDNALLSLLCYPKLRQPRSAVLPGIQFQRRLRR